MSKGNRQSLGRRGRSPRWQKMNSRAQQRSPRGESAHHDSQSSRSFRPHHNLSGVAPCTNQTAARDGPGMNDVATRKHARIAQIRQQKESWRGRRREDSTERLHEEQQRWNPEYPLRTDSGCASDDELLFDLCVVIDQIAPVGKTGLGECFRTANFQPPVTKRSLTELDINAIIVNPKLRHDVNFDRELHFRPNLDGDRGKDKLREAEKYWLALEAELTLYTLLFNSDAFGEEYRKSPVWSRYAQLAKRRIPSLFENIRGILRNLVPEHDLVRVDEHLDQDMLMQQINKGVCDLISLSKWMSHLLKEHCAPLRDEWVDKMVSHTKAGVETPSAALVVQGMKELLGILEAMKLDVANHQIRHLRALLIDDTVNFEMKYQINRIRNPKKVDVAACSAWFAGCVQQAARLDVASQKHSKLAASHPNLVVFVRAILHLLLDQDLNTAFPQPLHLDFERLRAIRSELHDLVYFEICNARFNWIITQIATRNRFPQPAVPDFAIRLLREALFTVVTEPDSTTKQWLKNIPNIAVEMVRHALHVCGFKCQYDAELVELTERWLRDGLDSSYPIDFSLYAANIEQSICPVLLETVEKHVHCSPIELFNSLITTSSSKPPGQRAPPPPLPPITARTGLQSTSPPPLPKQNPPLPPLTAPQHSLSPFHDLARRITHITVLHWHIWAPILYLKPSAPSPPPSPAIESALPVSAHLSLSIRPRSSTIDAHALQSLNTSSASDLDINSSQTAQLIVLTPSAEEVNETSGEEALGNDVKNVVPVQQQVQVQVQVPQPDGRERGKETEGAKEVEAVE